MIFDLSFKFTVMKISGKTILNERIQTDDQFQNQKLPPHMCEQSQTSTQFWKDCHNIFIKYKSPRNKS